jgi:hypothetical protein
MAFLQKTIYLTVTAERTSDLNESLTVSASRYQDLQGSGGEV